MIPAPLDLVAEFVNTRAITAENAYAREDLPTPAALDAWWRSHGVTARATESDLADALTLREGLRALLARNNDASLDGDEAAIIGLAELAATLTLHVTYPADGPTVEPTPYTTPARATLAGLLARTVAAQAAGTWQRLKVCRSPDCREAFYDGSRNHSGTWCSMAVCGARAKQRAFVDRRRQRNKRGQ